MSNTVSRYRSQRKPHQDGEEFPASPPEMPNPSSPPPQDESVVRSKSRYRRKDSVGAPRPSTAAHSSGSSPQAMPASSPQTRPARYSSQKQSQPLQHSASTREQRSSPQSQPGAQDMRRVASNDRDYERDMERREQLKAQSGFKQQEHHSNGVVHSSSPPHATSPVAASTKPPPPTKHAPSQKPATAASPPHTTTSDLFPPPRKPAAPHDEAPKSENISATKTAVTQPRYEFDNDDESEGGGGCFGLFKRKRQSQPTVSEKVPIARPPTSKGNRDIKIGGGGAVPGVDAPLSAVNAGDRRVIIQYNGRNITLPVTPTTTPIDLIKSSSTVMSDHVEVKSAVLLEEFSTVGVQRPLRRYEHVRDIMNSWDDDKQNRLILVDPGTGSSEAELSLQGVPSQQPGDHSWLIHYSQRPGKWDRRHVSLRQDGQLIVAKDLDKPHEAQNLCHLSDFDIYTPTQDKIRRKVKPPKKYCYAIKSQQKSSMFESTNNFVHFFSIADKRDADLFYAEIQGWRSWYLVNVLGEGSKIKNSPPANVVEAQEVREEAKREDSGGLGGNHRKMESLDSHYQLGSFQPLIDMDLNAFGDDARPQTSRSQARGIIPGSAFANAKPSEPERTKSSRRKNPPPYLKKGKLAEDEPLANLERKRASLDVKRDTTEAANTISPLQGEFSDNGLLGRTYSQKRKEHEDREQKKTPWTLGPNLLNGGFDSREEDFSAAGGRTSNEASAVRREKSVRNRGSSHKPASGDLGRSRSTRDRGASIDLQRSGSRRGADAYPPKPLVDLTPQYREPPQHQKKGHGHKPGHVGPGGLIDSATSPEDPLNVPPSVDWRGRNAQHQHGDAHQSRARSHSRAKQNGVSRSHSQHRPTTSSRNVPPPIPSPQDDEAFTGEGLLAYDGGGNGWGSAQKGRGVMDGSHARGPMIDMSNESKFVQGSLLNKVEKEQGGPLADNLIIEREKRREKNVPTGEAY
ncbi:hypothetical protein K431DRAFT_281144 [Polychaeton citri CBS 116435]|uniref:PH domain-containing protein n=1 Tax=Polychaeton citri CBS 116435 TaxID=1314669 RepID=A0A9P4QHW3_9PEZI|nr:hypothetical protein K431DRAFT_281144 [Polychaeton citri CBS 116435]